VELMQKMQSFGNPPEGLVEDLAPGMDMGGNGIPNGEEGGVPDCKSM
jgi:hypothetical protein